MIKQREDQNTMNLMIKHRNVDHEAAWEEIMKWESRHTNKEGTDFRYFKYFKIEILIHFPFPLIFLSM